MLSHAPRDREYQQGQALVLGLAAVGVAGIGLVMLYNIGHVAAARSRLTHATDAAAYSAALVQARTLNMLAHVQRAQVGHQVALAHLVTLGTWSQFSDTQNKNYKRGNPPGTVIGKFFGGIHRQSYARSGAMAQGTRAALQRAIRSHDDIGHQVLGKVAYDLVHGLTAARAAVIDQVLEANLSERPGGETMPMSAIRWSLHDDTWSDLLVSRTPGMGKSADLLRKMVQDAVIPYRFLASRNKWTANVWSIHPACPWMLHVLKRQGVTWLDKDGQWHSSDTQSFHARRYNRYIGCYYREYPMGEGAAAARKRKAELGAQDAFPDLSGESYWKWSSRAYQWDLTSTHNRWALIRAMARGWGMPQRGLPTWYDTQSETTGHGNFVLRVHQSSDSIVSTNRMFAAFRPQGRFAAGTHEGGALSATAGGQSYFSSTRDNESVSSFRPMWRARLVPLSKQKGQGVVGSLVAIVLLIVFIAAVVDMGSRFSQVQADDASSRWLAFIVAPGAAPVVTAAAGQSQRLSPSSLSAETLRGAPLHVSVGGRTQQAKEMRVAWGYEDRGLVGVRVGARRSFVARDAGHHHDHRATQSRIARSDSAWGNAMRSSRSLASQIDMQSRLADSGWRRPALSLDWLARWARLDLRSKPRRFRCRRRRRVFHNPGGRSRSLARLCRLVLLMGAYGTSHAASIQAQSLIDATCMAGTGLTQRDAIKGVHAALAEANRLAGLLNGLSLPGKVSSSQALVWFGVPMATRDFAFNAQSVKVIDLLHGAQPVLRDFGVLGVTFILAGVSGNNHWLARWAPAVDTPKGVSGTLSVLQLAPPQFDAMAPHWLPSDSHAVSHVIYPPSNDHAAAVSKPVIQAIWRSKTAVDHLTNDVARRLTQQGWKASAPNVNPAHWTRGQCAMTTHVVRDPTASSGSAIMIDAWSQKP